MERPTIIAGNWKMHKTIGETIDFINALIPQVKQSHCQVLIAPSFTAIHAAASAAKNSKLIIGAQNMSDQEEGAFTGEVSARMLKDAGASFVILGHSERRLHFGETNEHIHHKLKRAILETLPAILCIGESESERANGKSIQVLTTQIDECLKNFSPQELTQVTIAYEPVWAIGTGKTATPEIAQETHRAIRTHIAKKWGDESGKKICILYGGSVKPNNIENLLKQDDIDGALIGGASLDVEALSKMVNQ